MASSRFSVHPVTSADVPDLVQIFADAFDDDPIVSGIQRDVELGAKIKGDEELFALWIRNAKRDGFRWDKACEGNVSGKAVAFCKWTIPHTLTAQQEEEISAEKISMRAMPTLPGTNLELRHAFLGALSKARDRWIDPAKDYFVHILVVSPHHQRQGLGSLLLEHRLKAVDNENARTYIEASAAGLGLYLKHGWAPVDEIVLDCDALKVKSKDGKYVTGVYRQKMLIRDPKAGSSVM